MTDQFTRFSERGRRALALAQEEAQRFNHNYIGTEHLLLGLLRQPNSTAARALSNFGIEPDKVRSAVEFIIGRGGQRPGREIGLTSRVMKVMEYAVDEARRLGHSYIGTEHLLLGLMREGEGIAAGALQSAGADIDAVRREVMRLAEDPEVRRVREAAAGRIRAAQEALATAASGPGGRLAVDLLVPQLARAAELATKEHTRRDSLMQTLGEASAIHRLLQHGQRALAEAGEQAAADALREAAAAFASVFPVPGGDPGR